ncbi:MAG: aminoacyl-tRNA hydrolase [Actinomycetota bacterium]|nr:aminoacyl-tRNA hydrolase [Actinomycetota bacterium]
MRLVVGLWNPGSRYDGTRHNIGGDVVVGLARTDDATLRRAPQGIRADVAQLQLDGARLVLAVPRTFMNESGQAVAPLLRYYTVDPGDLLVVHDDIDLEFGKMRVQIDRGAGGHNGIRSIIQSLGSRDFWRLRIGVGRPPDRIDPADYVLGRFSRREREAVPDVAITAGSLIENFVVDGGDAARQQAGEINIG